MPDLLRRSQAPLTEAAWDEVDGTASRILKAHLSARALVDFSGPHGWEFAAINSGRLSISRKASPGGVPWGTRGVLPLVEVRVPFELDQMELDSIARGAADPDLGPLEQTARNVALFEESAVYNGFAAGGIRGIVEASEHKPLKLPTNVRQYPNMAAEAVTTLKQTGIDGPYVLVLGTKPFQHVMQGTEEGYPTTRLLSRILDGKVLWSPALEGGVVLTTRGGDFELTVGQDLAIGYASHTRNRVELFLTESFTFRVLDPAAAVVLKAGTK